MTTQLSYASSPQTGTYDYNTYTAMIRQWADLFPEKEAFVEYSLDGHREALTCQGLLERSLKLGKILVQTGLQKGDIVVFCMNNSLQMIVALFGVVFAGGVPIFTSANMADGSDVIELLRETDAVLFVIDATNNSQNWKLVENVNESDCNIKKILCNGTNDAHGWNSDDILFLSEMVRTVAEDTTDLPTIYPEDIALYFKTSGSTGKPKLVGHSHLTWLNNTRLLNDEIGLVSSSKYFCDRPFSWGLGPPRTFLASGCTRIFVDTRLTLQQGNIDMICKIIEREGCSHLYLPGYLVTDIIARPDLKSMFTTVRSVVCSGERFPIQFTRLLPDYCSRLLVWYGSTEATGVSSFYNEDPGKYEDGIIGLPSPGVEMKLVDGNNAVVKRGETGELCTRSIYRFSEYRGRPEEFAKVVDHNNWFHTGDVGYIRPDGNFVLEGRRSEQISMASMKFFPFDIEKTLITCPFVIHAVVVPIPDIRLHNVICACVIVDKSLQQVSVEEVKAFCDKIWVDDAAAVGLSLKPKHILLFEQFPASATGKLDRKGVKEEAITLLKHSGLLHE